jgi:hypothetical protein
MLNKNYPCSQLTVKKNHDRGEGNKKKGLPVVLLCASKITSFSQVNSKRVANTSQLGLKQAANVH